MSKSKQVCPICGRAITGNVKNVVECSLCIMTETIKYGEKYPAVRKSDIKNLRKYLKLSVSGLADKWNVTNGAIISAEAGDITMQIFNKYYNELEIQPDYVEILEEKRNKKNRKGVSKC